MRLEETPGRIKPVKEPPEPGSPREPLKDPLPGRPPEEEPPKKPPAEDPPKPGEMGNLSNVKGVGEGVFERKIDFGPGYRIYFGKAGESVVILLGGSGKPRQREAIATAQERWTDYKRRKGTR